MVKSQRPSPAPLLFSPETFASSPKRCQFLFHQALRKFLVGSGAGGLSLGAGFFGFGSGQPKEASNLVKIADVSASSLPESSVQWTRRRMLSRIDVVKGGFDCSYQSTTNSRRRVGRRISRSPPRLQFWSRKSGKPAQRSSHGAVARRWVFRMIWDWRNCEGCLVLSESAGTSPRYV